jgi:RimJ/RimL family protein N-acetyltransferase
MTVAAALASTKTPARVRLRPTMQSDLDFVLSLEQDPANLPFIRRGAHAERGGHPLPDFRHFIIEAGAGLDAAGFVILIGCRSQNQSLELKRMVVQEKGLGYGRAALRVIKKIVFDDLAAHRFWLDVKERNARAQGLYQSEGFELEGRLRDAVRVADGRDSLIVMSMLAPEFAARRWGQEMFA